MNAEKDKVLITKQSLMNGLGEETWKKYLMNLKLWFKQKYTKSEFDMNCRKLLTPNQVRLHNQFFLAILNKIDVLEPVSVKIEQTSNSNNNNATNQLSKNTSKKRKRNSENATFDPAFVMEYIPYENCSDPTPHSTPPPTIRYAAQELFLPDNGLVMGRLLVAAWEVGLTSADEAAVDLVVTGVQTLLKNILTSVITKKKHFKVTADSKYLYDVGAPLKDPFLRNTVTRPKIDDEPIELDKEISSVSLARRVNEESIFLSACEEPATNVRKRISTVDIYKTLMDKNIIPSHSVHSINIERISCMLT